MNRQRVLPVRSLSAPAFSPYGRIATPQAHDAPPGRGDAQPDLSGGTPRFYIMRLRRRGLLFSEIARHVRVTQCLGAMGGQAWLIAVAPPAALDDTTACPDPAAIVAFRIPGDAFIMLSRGTWHAGPYFDACETIDFFNLELADTNRTDFQACDLRAAYSLEFAFAEDEAQG